MHKRNQLLKKLFSLTIGAMLLGPFAANATIMNATYSPLITSGALPDSPSAHIDPNTPDSPYSGVVSINIRYDGNSFICSGALVGQRTVLSAGHCVDTDGNGTVVDLNKPGTDVRVVFNNNGTSYKLVTGTAVAMNPDYKGFGNCPAGINAFCVNDDVALITLGEDAPSSAKIYKIAVNNQPAGTRVTMAGYGRSGDGVNGYYVPPSFFTKRTGENYIDLFDGDDEQAWGGPNEVWYADFDGNGQDAFCTRFNACSPVLPNHRESGIGGGDSGGPSFVNMYGELMLVANNTFSGTFTEDQVEGSFGTFFGGILMSSYADWLANASGNRVTLVPEPGSFALLGLGALMLVGARRRVKA